MTWLVEQAGDCITKWQANHDGKTAYQRLMCQPCCEESLEFGEMVNYKLPSEDLGDLDGRWSSGVWLGKRWKSTEHLVHENGEVIHCRAVSRKPLEERWDGPLPSRPTRPLHGDCGPAQTTRRARRVSCRHSLKISNLNPSLRPRNVTPEHR